MCIRDRPCNEPELDLQAMRIAGVLSRCDHVDGLDANPQVGASFDGECRAPVDPAGDGALGSFAPSKNPQQIAATDEPEPIATTVEDARSDVSARRGDPRHAIASAKTGEGQR